MTELDAETKMRLRYERLGRAVVYRLAMALLGAWAIQWLWNGAVGRLFAYSEVGYIELEYREALGLVVFAAILGYCTRLMHPIGSLEDKETGKS